MSDTVQSKPKPLPIQLSQRDYLLIGAFFVLLLGSFWPMWQYLPQVWFAKDGYYSHGVLVPLLSGYLVWLKREQLAATRVSPSIIGAPILAFGLLGAVYGKRIDSQTVFQLSFFIFTFGTLIFLFGGAITRQLVFPVLFLGFMLPLPDFLFDSYTNPAQVVSTKVANAYLNVVGFQTMMDQNNIISMDHYSLNVGIPCSGFKTSISLLTFGLFFMAIAKLSWWKNMILFASLLPIAIAINGLRIAVIGVVGEKVWISHGETQAHYWGNLTHDYSGYVVLLLAFVMLFGLARWLGWKW